MVLAAALPFLSPGLASLLPRWTLGLHGLRVVLAIGLFLGMGAVSLWPLASSRAMRLGVVPRPRVGAGVGHMASIQWALRLGATATYCNLCKRYRLASQGDLLQG